MACVSPSVKSMMTARGYQKKIANRARANHGLKPEKIEWPEIPERIEDLEIPEGLTMLEDGTEFLLFDTGTYILTHTVFPRLFVWQLRGCIR